MRRPKKPRVLTREEFEGMPPRVRGYLVAWLGPDLSQPNIPSAREYKVKPEEKAEFRAGMEEAVTEALSAVSRRTP